MDAERDEHLGEPSSVPEAGRWDRLADLSGDDLEYQYRHTLENLALETGLIGTVFRQAPAVRRRHVEHAGAVDLRPAHQPAFHAEEKSAAGVGSG